MCVCVCWRGVVCECECVGVGVGVGVGVWVQSGRSCWSSCSCVLILCVGEKLVQNCFV